MRTRLAAIVGTVGRFVRRARCCGRHTWIALDADMRKCWRCDYVQNRLTIEPVDGVKLHKWVTANAEAHVPTGAERKEVT